MAEQAVVTRRGALDMQVCVPSYWSDSGIVKFANIENPCGTKCGWVIRKKGDPALEGADERSKCNTRKGFVHVMLDA